jgi:hypothetical protein
VIAHVSGVPLEEMVLQSAPAAGAGLVLAGAWIMRLVRGGR